MVLKRWKTSLYVGPQAWCTPMGLLAVIGPSRNEKRLEAPAFLRTYFCIMSRSRHQASVLSSREGKSGRGSTGRKTDFSVVATPFWGDVPTALRLTDVRDSRMCAPSHAAGSQPLAVSRQPGVCNTPLLAHITKSPSLVRDGSRPAVPPYLAPYAWAPDLTRRVPKCTRIAI